MANYTEFEDKMKKTLTALGNDYAGLRAGRANPAVLDRLRVDYYGASSKINEVAAVSVPEPRMLMIQPWDVTLVKEIEKAILASDIGITPSNDGKVIRLNFPQPTEERRKELAKEAKKLGEDAKVAVRNVRRDALDKFKKQEKAKEITEDELKGIETDVQKLTDKYIAEIDKMVSEKEKEIMAV